MQKIGVSGFNLGFSFSESAGVPFSLFVFVGVPNVICMYVTVMYGWMDKSNRKEK